MCKEYVIIHTGVNEAGYLGRFGGFGKRFDMFIAVLRKKGDVRILKFLSGLFHLLSHRFSRNNNLAVIIYFDIFAPLIIAIRIFWPSLSIYYMVRGDHISFAKQAKRYIRTMVAFLFQKLLVILGCHFVFVCEDLHVLFEKRLGRIKKFRVLPNTLGKPLPDIRPFDGRVALVGDFNTVKNVEWAIENLSSGKFEIHLYGNRTSPEKWQRPWLQLHGVVEDLSSALRQSASLVVLSDISAGFPNVVVEALEAGCSVVVHRAFPFKYLPIADEWRFSLNSTGRDNCNLQIDSESKLELTLERLLRKKRDFKRDNHELIELIESDWEERVWEIFS